MVSQAILYITRQPQYKGLVPTDLAEATERILLAFTEGKKYVQQIDSCWFKIRRCLWENFIIPGIRLHYVMRKRFIEEVTVKAINEGFTQVVNFGAGLDTLFLRLCQRYPEVDFIEMDYPTTHAVKAKAIGDILASDGTQPGNLRLFPTDLNDALQTQIVTQAKWFNPARKTLFIFEAVLMYLEETSVINLFADLQNATHEETKIIFTCIEPLQSKRNNVSGLLKFYLKLVGEPVRWTIAQEKLPDFLADQGYTMEFIATFKTFEESYLKNYKLPKILHQGEYIGIAKSF